MNVNCLTNKLNDVNSLMNSSNIDVLGISETWLKPAIPDSFVCIPNYKLTRSDSPTGVGKHGVAVYVHQKYKFKVIDCIVPNVVIICLLDYSLHIVTVYRPPSYNIDENRQLISFLSSFCLNKEIILQGDFNLPSIHWELDDVFDFYISPLDLEFFDLFVNAGLLQLVREATNFPSGNILDLCLVSLQERIALVKVLPPFPRCSHGCVLIEYIFQDNFLLEELSFLPEVNRVWSKGRYDLISKAMLSIDWYHEFYSLGATDQYNALLRYLDAFVDLYVPTKPASNGDKVPWQVNPSRALQRKKADAWNKYKLCRTSFGRRSPIAIEAWGEFASVADEVRLFSINSQKTYERSLASQIQTNPKLFHSYLNHRKVGKPSIGPLLLDSGVISDDPQVMASCFLDAFSSVFVSDMPINNVTHQVCTVRSGSINITPEIVQDVLSNLDGNSSMGADGIHPKLLKNWLQFYVIRCA